MEILIIAFTIYMLLANLLPFSKSSYWWIRVFDYPRAQIVLLNILAVVLLLVFMDGGWIIAAAVALAGLSVYQAVLIYRYTFLAGKQTRDAQEKNKDCHMRMLIANVRMSNKEYGKLLSLINKNEPDLVLLMEADRQWEQAVSEVIAKDYKGQVLQPQDNTYGMLLYSRLELHTGEVKFLIEKGIPSIHAVVKLRSGDPVKLYCLHPEPPHPASDTDERDAELLIVGKTIKKEEGIPAIVAGDLNDVAWSHTTRLFQRISGTSDPRVGRGFFNTYNANVPFFRFPLDHVFHTPHFALQELRRLPHIGSDHFPILVEFSFEPQNHPVTHFLENDEDYEEEANEKIENGK